MFGKSKKKGMACAACEALSLVSLVLNAVVTLAALVGVFKAHVLSSGFAFGTSTGSLSIVALVLCLFFLQKTVVTCCSCTIETKKK